MNRVDVDFILKKLTGGSEEELRHFCGRLAEICGIQTSLDYRPSPGSSPVWELLEHAKALWDSERRLLLNGALKLACSGNSTSETESERTQQSEATMLQKFLACRDVISASDEILLVLRKLELERGESVHRIGHIRSVTDQGRSLDGNINNLTKKGLVEVVVPTSTPKEIKLTTRGKERLNALYNLFK